MKERQKVVHVEVLNMLTPNLQFLLNAADAFMRAIAFLILFGFLAIAWRQVFG